jgi:hypothetical protein
MGKDTVYKFRVGDVDGELLAWDGTNFYLKSDANNYLKATGTSMEFYSGGVKVIDITNTPSVLIGQAAANQSNVLITSGAINLRNNTTNKIVLSNAGVITIGEVGASQSNVLISSGAVKLRNNTTDKISLNADGTSSFDGVMNLGSAGGIFQGTGTFASPTTALKIYNSGGVGLWELWGSGTKQAYADTDGKLKFGGNSAGYLDADGVHLYSSDSYTWPMVGGSKISWGADQAIYAYIVDSLLQEHTLVVRSTLDTSGGDDSAYTILCAGPVGAVSDKDSARFVAEYSDHGLVTDYYACYVMAEDQITIDAAAIAINGATTLTGSATITGGLNVGTATGAGTGDVKCSGNITAGPGVTAGSFVAASAGNYYVGDSVTDGSWRMGRSGDNLVFQRRVAGNWVTKSTIAA